MTVMFIKQFSKWFLSSKKSRCLGLSYWIIVQNLNIYVPHFNLNCDYIRVESSKSLSTPMRKKYPLPTFLQSVKEILLGSCFEVCNHISIAWGEGLGPTTFAFKSWSFKSSMHANNIWELTLNVTMAFLTKNPLKFLSTFDGRIPQMCILSMLIFSSWCMFASFGHDFYHNVWHFSVVPTDFTRDSSSLLLQHGIKSCHASIRDLCCKRLHSNLVHILTRILSPCSGSTS